MQYVTVEHMHYGCESGCCGHDINLWDETGLIGRHFEFTHNYDDQSDEDWARELAEAYYPGIPFNWEESYVAD